MGNVGVEMGAAMNFQGLGGLEKQRQFIFKIEGLRHNVALEITAWTVQILHQYLDLNIKKSP